MPSTREKSSIKRLIYSMSKKKALLAIENLSISFANDQGRVPAVNNLSLQIDTGETVALVGESGSGKSVTALSILGLLAPTAHYEEGSVRFKGRELCGADGATLRQIRGDRIGMIFQEPMTSLNPLHRVEKQIAETLLLHKGFDPRRARTRTLELLRHVRIQNPEEKLEAYPHQLSGGQRQRVMIAMALANEPDLLIADEPTTAVDVTAQAQILALLQDLQREFQMAVLLITHDLSVVQLVAKRLYVMRAGSVLESGPIEQVFTDPQHDYTRQLINAEPPPRESTADPHAPVVLRSQDIRVWYPIKRGILRRTVGHVKAANSVTLSIRSGHTTGLVGESGSGKSTLALALLRLVESNGQIEFLGAAIDQLDSRQLKPLRRQMQVVFQDPYGSLSPRFTVAQIIAEGLHAHDLGDSGTREAQVVAALEEVGIDPSSRHRYPHEFSGGQRQRIALARAMILKPRLLILDEPTSALDRAVQVQMIALLKTLQQRHGLAYLFISHDLRVVRALSDEIIVMRAGEVVEHGDADDVLNRPRAAYTRALVSAAFDLRVTDENAVAQ